MEYLKEYISPIMSDSLERGCVISLCNGENITIEEKLGEGGQGCVYKVDLNGQKYALKWYHIGAIRNPVKFYSNLNNNVRKGAPNNNQNFIWPLYVTEKCFGSFGYVMKLRPSEYKDFYKFLLAEEHFSSISAVVNAALTITNAFRDLHREGLSYQDLNDGNLFIDPNTGDVLICDNDNVAPDGDSLGIAGKAGYMAPEVIRNISKPNNHTDRFSLAIILFKMLFLDHPLEGKRVLSTPCLTDQLDFKFFAKEPIFIFDPVIDLNRPVPEVHRNVTRLWNIYPRFVQESFEKAFSQEAMNADDINKARHSRLTDNDWHNVFVKLRSLVVKCDCGSDTLIDINKDTNCVNCGRTIAKPSLLKSENLKHDAVPLYPGVKIYAGHLDKNCDDFETVCATVTRNPRNPAIWGIHNLSGYEWTLYLRDGSTKQLPNGSIYAIQNLESIRFDSDSFGFIEF